MCDTFNCLCSKSKQNYKLPEKALSNVTEALRHLLCFCRSLLLYFSCIKHNYICMEDLNTPVHVSITKGVCFDVSGK